MDAAVGRAVVAVLLIVDVSLVAESNASLKDEDEESTATKRRKKRA